MFKYLPVPDTKVVGTASLHDDALLHEAMLRVFIDMDVTSKNQAIGRKFFYTTKIRAST